MVNALRPKLVLSGLMGLIGLIASLHVAWTVFHWGGEPLREWIGDLSQTLIILLAAAVCLLISQLHQGANRLGWGFMGSGLLVWGMGNALWAYYELILNQQPFPSFADVGYLVAPPLMIVGVWLFPRPRLSGIQNFQLGLDVGVIVGALGALLWPLILAPAIESYGQVSLSMVLGLAYPVMDLALIGLLLSILLRRPEHTLGADKALLAAGLIFLVIADLSFNTLSAAGTYQTGGLTDVFWNLWGVAFALAAYTSLSQSTQKRLERGLAQLRLSRVRLLAPYFSVVIAYGLILYFRDAKDSVELGLEVAAGLVTLLVIARQTLTLFENQQLTEELKSFNYELEQRVEERTQELEEHRERLMASEKLASLGRLTAGIAHEINTPLAASMNHLMQARKLTEEYRDSIGLPQVGPEDHREIAAELDRTLADANASLERMGEFIRKMRAQGRNPVGVISSFDPVRIAQETLTLLEQSALNAQVQLDLKGPQTLNLHGEAGRFSQVLSNLVQNAIHACENRLDGVASRVTVEFSQDPQHLYVKVSDNGSGIPPEVLPKIFEPLFTTKPVGKGTGLGLPIIRDIVKGHFAGEISLETETGKGTTFTLHLPLKAQPSPAPVLERTA